MIIKKILLLSLLLLFSCGTIFSPGKIKFDNPQELLHHYQNINMDSLFVKNLCSYSDNQQFLKMNILSEIFNPEIQTVVDLGFGLKAASILMDSNEVAAELFIPVQKQLKTEYSVLLKMLRIGDLPLGYHEIVKLILHCPLVIRGLNYQTVRLGEDNQIKFVLDHEKKLTYVTDKKLTRIHSLIFEDPLNHYKMRIDYSHYQTVFNYSLPQKTEILINKNSSSKKIILNRIDLKKILKKSIS